MAETATRLTQCEKILKYIEETGSITQMDALREFGCMRLASRMCDIKKMGYAVEMKMEKAKNRYGDAIKYARYFICE
jgi:hypothetical protein